MAKEKSLNETFSHNLWKEIVGCAKLKNQIVAKQAILKKEWTVKRSYLSLFSCEEGVNKVIKAHMTKEAEING